MLACLRRRRLGPLQLQPAIQALHCAAVIYEQTDWAAIVRFYDRLFAVMPTPGVALNRAVAVAETDGPAASLVLLDDLAADLAGYHPPCCPRFDAGAATATTRPPRLRPRGAAGEHRRRR